jgi:hypothetical protein
MLRIAEDLAQLPNAAPQIISTVSSAASSHSRLANLRRGWR